MHIHLPKPVHGWRAFVGEVGIIVIGILIALGAEQLVEWVHWRHKQHETLERLFEESRIDVAQLRSPVVSGQEIKREVEFATELTSGRSCPSPQQWSAVDTVTMYPEIRVQTSVYDEVVGAGGLADIGSDASRDAVASFHSSLAGAQGMTTFFRAFDTPPVASDDPRVTITYDPQEQSRPNVVRYNRAALCRDAGFRNRVADDVGHHVSWDSFRHDLTKDAIRMCAVIGHALGKQCTPASGPPFTPAEERIVSEAP